MQTKRGPKKPSSIVGVRPFFHSVGHCQRQGSSSKWVKGILINKYFSSVNSTSFVSSDNGHSLSPVGQLHQGLGDTYFWFIKGCPMSLRFTFSGGGRARNGKAWPKTGTNQVSPMKHRHFEPFYTW